MKISSAAYGKVLICGGYLILQKPNEGIVLSIEPSISCNVMQSELNDTLSTNKLYITWRNPQFHDEQIYVFDGDIKTLTTSDNVINQDDLLSSILIITLSFIYEALKRSFGSTNSIILTCLSDERFYSQIHNNWSGKIESKYSILKHVNIRVSDVKKTGLGSSAALTASIVSCLLKYFISHKEVDIEMKLQKITHILSEYIHTRAQGGVGSGFDIASSIYGSLCFMRSDPLPFISFDQEYSIVDFTKQRSEQWNGKLRKFTLPRCWRVVMAEVSICSGTRTQSMTKKIMSFFSNHSRGKELWLKLATFNQRIISIFESMGCMDESNNLKTIDQRLIYQLKYTYQCYRKTLLEISSISCNEDNLLEQPFVTHILDNMANIDGVVIAGIPGAGGQDAIFCIVQDENVIENVYSLWENISKTSPNNVIIYSFGVVG